MWKLSPSFPSSPDRICRLRFNTLQPSHLLQIATDLANFNARRPRRADLCRATSTAYYAFVPLSSEGLCRHHGGSRRLRSEPAGMASGVPRSGARPGEETLRESNHAGVSRRDTGFRQHLCLAATQASSCRLRPALSIQQIRSTCGHPASANSDQPPFQNAAQASPRLCDLRIDECEGRCLSGRRAHARNFVREAGGGEDRWIVRYLATPAFPRAANRGNSSPC